MVGWETIVAHWSTWIDPAIWKAYQLGIGLGVVILTTLILFPGSKTPLSEAKSQHPRQPDGRNETEAKSQLNDKAREHPAPASLTQPFPPPRKSKNAYWTPHRRLNTGVYLIIWTVVAVTIIQSYSGDDNSSTTPRTADSESFAAPTLSWVDRHPIALMLRAYFPKEASVLLGRRPTQKQMQRAKK